MGWIAGTYIYIDDGREAQNTKRVTVIVAEELGGGS